MALSIHPVTVDGVSLDTVAYNIEAKTRQWPAARAADVAVPGVDGEIASLNDDLDSTLVSLSMWVLGTDTTGAIPGGSTAMDQCRANMDTLAHLFRKTHALLDVRETSHTSGTIRQAYCKVVDAIAPDIKAGGLGRFTVSLKVPDGLWQDVSTADWTSTPTIVSGNFYEITTLQGATGPTNDAIILVTGPVTNPKLTDFTTGAYVQLNQTLTGSQFWRLNMATWSTRYGASLTLGSTDATGTDGQASTVFGGGKAQFLRLVPSVVTGLRRSQISLTGTGITSATTISVRARRKFLQ
jgi:hypothetical protein